MGDTLVYLLNAAPEATPFVLPSFMEGVRWECLIDTGNPGLEGQVFDGGHRYPLGERSVVIFRMR